MKPYIHFEEDDTGCYSQKLSEEVFRLQKSYILENTPSLNGSVKKQNTVWKWKNWQIEEDAYKHVISKEDRKELGTAIGLFTSGVGAGSYVYLRRILERLIYQAKTAAGDAHPKYNYLRNSEQRYS